MGDIINLIPAIAVLDNEFKDAEITIVAPRGWEEIIKSIPKLINILFMN